jgi:hypothetical protein
LSDYSKTTNFTAKDALSTGDPNKLVKGADFDTEFDSIATAVATKYDSDDIASQAVAEAGTSNTTVMTPLRTQNWADTWKAENAGMLGDIHALASPGADRLLFWDNSAAAAALLTVSTGLTLSGTTLTSNDSAIVHDSLSGFVANEHIDHSTVSVTAGTGLSGGGTIAATRSINLSHLGIESLADPNADRIAFWDDSAGAFKWLVPSSGISITTTNLNVDHDAATNFVANEHINHTSVSVTAGTGLSGGGTIAATRTINVDMLGLEDLIAPGADRIYMYDQSALAAKFLTVGTNLSISGTTISAPTATLESAINHDNLTGFVANEHINHTSVTLTAGSGLTGGGDISANRTFTVGAGTGITVNANDVALASTAAGTGLTHSSGVLNVIGGNGITANANDIELSSTVPGTGLTMTTGVINVIGGNGITANANDIAITNQSVSTSVPVGFSSGSLTYDPSSLTAFGTSAGVDLDVDDIILEDNGVSKLCPVSQVVTPQVPTVTGTTDTLAESDFGKAIIYSNASITVTLPNSLKTGYWATLIYSGTGTLTLSATTTLRTANSLTACTQQYGSVSVLHVGSNVWYAWGALDS